MDQAKEEAGDSDDKSYVDKCMAQTEALRNCMIKHKDYYGDMIGDEEEETTPAKDGEQGEEAVAAASSPSRAS